MIQQLTKAFLIPVHLFVAGTLAAQGPESPAGDDNLTPDQSRLFDELIERESRNNPENVMILEDDPGEAAALVEEEDPNTDVTAATPVRITGTFLQPSLEYTELSVQDWIESLRLLRDAGVDKVIVQWSASDKIAYFQPAPDRYPQSYPLINRLLDAASQTDVRIVLGLTHDPLFWKNIQTRPDVLDVYFRVRNTHNLRLQEALLEAFDTREFWTGYYLSEEIDDLNWRELAREKEFKQYLLRSGRILRERDEERSFSVSSFFRKRTAPSRFANNLLDLVQGTEIGQVWVQDGIGVEVLSTPLIEPYYSYLQRIFSGSSVSVGIIVELFEQVSEPGKPFEAESALPSRVKRQLQDASLVSDEALIFSFFDYADPREGDRQREIYQLLKNWNASLGHGASETGENNLLEQSNESADENPSDP